MLIIRTRTLRVVLLQYGRSCFDSCQAFQLELRLLSALYLDKGLKLVLDSPSKILLLDSAPSVLFLDLAGVVAHEILAIEGFYCLSGGWPALLFGCACYHS